MKKIILVTGAFYCLTTLAACVPVYTSPEYVEEQPTYGYSSLSAYYYSNPTYVRYGAPPNARLTRERNPREKLAAAPYWHAQHVQAQNAQHNAPSHGAAQGHPQGGHGDRHE